MKCAIVRPLSAGWTWELEEPLGAEAIVGYLRERGIDSRVFDRRIGASVSDIRAYTPDLVGFSLMTAEDVPDALRLLQQLKLPGRRFFAGGLFVTGEEMRCRALFPKDTVLIRGEGEGPVLSLVTGKEEKAPDPDGWAFAARDDLAVYLAEGGAIHIRSSRGCRGMCRFCTTPGTFHSRHEERDISLVAEEMAAIAAQGHPPVFNFTDDEFGDLDRIAVLIEELDRRNVRAAFSLELRPPIVCLGSADLWKKLHRGGLCRVFTGLENLDRQVLRNWQKPTDPDRLLAAVKVCEEAGILCETGYILFHEKSSAASVLAQAEALHRLGRFTPKIALSILHRYPGSALFGESETGRTGPVTLPGDAAELYERWSEMLSECCRLWSDCAARLPNAACRGFLSGDLRQRDLLRRALGEINELTWDIIQEKPVSAAKKEELYALCSTALGTMGAGETERGRLR